MLFYSIVRLYNVCIFGTNILRPIIPRRLRATSPVVNVQSQPPSYESVVDLPPPYTSVQT